MSSTPEKPLDLSALTDKYEVVGEYAALGQSRRYPGRRRQDGRDVLITVLRAAPEVAQGKAIAQYAADANLMAGLTHPSVPQVLEGRWIGDDAFAIVTDRVQGTTLAELLKGERLTKPRIADILTDVDSVLEWARNERLSHRGVTPDSIWVERGTNRVFVTLGPTDAPKTNRPDPRDDARTIGTLALAMLTAKPMADDHDGTLINMRPDLPQRVADATEKLTACTINDETPNISAYLASLAMADAIKEGELEVARVEAEFRAQMKAEREKWEAEQLECRLANEDQAKKFAEERAEYERRSAKEKEQLATARAEVDKRRAEVQEARAELDNARAVYKEKKAALEARSKQVDKHMAELEKQKRALERRAAELEQRNLELQQFAALAASGAADDIAQRPTMEVKPVEDEEDVVDEPAQDDIAVMQEAVEAEEEVKGWTPIETEEPWAIPLDTDEPVREIQYQAAAVPEPERKGRPAWMIPAGIAGAVLLIGGAAFAVSRSGNDSPVVATASAPSPRTTASVSAPAMRTDSAGGTIAPVSDSAVFYAIRDSIVAADEARRIRRQRAAEVAAAEAAAERERRPAARTFTDSTGTVWLIDQPPPVTTPRPNPVVPPVTNPRPDTIARPVVPPIGAVTVPALPLRPDSIRPRPDTTRPRPDTLKCCG
jgi:hypothetical protein